MPFAVRRLPIVDRDLVAAGVWYDEHEPDGSLSEALVREADSVIFSLATDAELHRLRFRDVRRAPLRQFHFYGVYYLIRERTVVIIRRFSRPAASRPLAAATA